MAFEIGQTATRSKTITDEDVRLFAQVSGDHNPVHLDDEYAKGTMFGQRIAHGMLSVSVISALLGEDFPGAGSIYLGQNIKFVKPVFIGDTITVTATVTKYREDKRILSLDTIVTNQNGDTVVEGDAVLIAPEQS